MAAPDEHIGKTVAGKYLVEQMIGEGGMGKVYKAIQTALDKPVVLKVLRTALLSDERTVARFQREAKAASRLNHPNSISVLDFGQAEDGAMYIAMEYVQGKDLHQILSREWPLPESRVIRVMSQVLSALADAHSAGVIHRDLKPENIMVEQRRGEADFVKVLDFGIAKIVDGTDDEGPALTRAGFVCGTPEYMSPEQARGAQLDHRSDLYAVGVILYQLTSGLLPFDSESAVGFATKHLTETPVTPSKRRPEARVSPGMERLIMKSMAKSPDDRPQTAEQFRAELIAIEKERRASVPASARRTAGEAAPTRAVPAPLPLVASGPPTVPTAKPASSAKSWKGLVGVVVLSALALGATLAYVASTRVKSKETYLPPPNAPLTGSALYAYDPPRETRRPGDGAKLTNEGDAAWQKGSFELALSRYTEAWRADPQPGLSLKIGELYFQKKNLSEARAWWARHRKDAPETKALTYIEQSLSQ